MLALGEVQRIPGWPETVQRRWDEETPVRRPHKVVLLASVPLLMQQGLTESLIDSQAGRWNAWIGSRARHNAPALIRRAL